jgi:DNA-binding CsgD family transcriptional regulator
VKNLLPILIVHLLLIGTPVHSALPGPATLDSLLTLPEHQKYQLLRKILINTQIIGGEDTPSKLQIVKELTHFFISKGQKDDLLLLQTASFVAGICYPMDHESKLDWGNTLFQEAEALKDTFAMAAIQGAIGTYYYKYMHDHVKSFECMWRVNQLIHKLGPERYPGYEYSVYYLARSYFDFFDYENTIRQGNLLTYATPEDINYIHIFNSCLLGMSYYFLKKPVGARKHFLWGLHYVPKVFKDSPARKDIGWKGIFYGDIGLTYFQEGRYEQAVPYLRQGFELTSYTQYWDNVPVFGSKLARIHLENNQLAQAKKYAMLSIEAAHKMDTLIYPVCRYIAEPYEVMSIYYRKVSQPAYALAYADSAWRAYAEWKKVFDVGQKHQAEIAIAREEFLANEIKAKKEKERQDLFHKALIVLALLISSFSIILYLRHLLRAQAKQQMLAEHKKLTQQELQQAQAQLDQIKNRAHQNSAAASYAGRELALPESPDHVSSADPSLHRALYSFVILTDDDWSRFVQLFEKAYPGFLARLSFKLPDLTPAEVRFLALSRLGCSNREMAAMLGVGPGAIRQYRMRLRRKLHLPDHVEIEEMVAVI